MVGTSIVAEYRPEVARPAVVPPVDSPSSSQRTPSPILGPLVSGAAIAAAIAGIAELAVHRTVSPVISHVPGVPGGEKTVEIVRTAGEAMLGATAVAVAVATLALAAALRADRPAVAAVLCGTVVGGLAFAASGDVRIGAAFYALTLVAAVAVAVTSRKSAVQTAVLGLLALAFVASSWPHAAAAFRSAGLLAMDASNWTLPGAVAEAAFVTGVALCGVVVILTGCNSRATPWIAGGVGVLTAAALVVQPEHSAILSLWAAGVTLSLPPLVYVVAAVSLAAAITEWTVATHTRHLAAGLGLLVVAGVAPALTHHNLTALLGLALLALPPEPAPDLRSHHGQMDAT